MTQELYDVIVVGAAEATPAGEARLAAALARGRRMPVEAVARAVAEKNLRVGREVASRGRRVAGAAAEGWRRLDLHPARHGRVGGGR